MTLDQLKKAVTEAGLTTLSGSDPAPVNPDNIFCIGSCIACQTSCTLGCSQSCLGSSSKAQ